MMKTERGTSPGKPLDAAERAVSLCALSRVGEGEVVAGEVTISIADII